MSPPLGSDRLVENLRDSASLLGSRVCHDLISPLGAISNGLELLSMSGLNNSPELKLIEESIESANARVRFFRVVFGASSGAQIMARPEVSGLLAGVYSGGRLNVRWESPSDPTRTEAKVGFLAIMCAESALPNGGEITITSDRGEWQLQAYGPKIKFETEFWSVLKGNLSTEIPSSKVQFSLLAQALSALDRKPQVGHSDSAVSIRY